MRNAVVGSIRIANARYTSVPSTVAVNPTTNRIYAGSGASNLISVIDGQTNQIVASVDVGVGSGTAGIAVNPATNRIYATGGSRLTVIDGKTNTILKTIDLPAVAIGNDVALDPATNLVYVAAIDQSVAVVDGATGRIVATAAALASSTPGATVDDARAAASSCQRLAALPSSSLAQSRSTRRCPTKVAISCRLAVGSTTTPPGTASTAEVDSPRSATQ